MKMRKEFITRLTADGVDEEKAKQAGEEALEEIRNEITFIPVSEVDQVFKNAII